MSPSNDEGSGGRDEWFAGWIRVVVMPMSLGELCGMGMARDASGSQKHGQLADFYIVAVPMFVLGHALAPSRPSQRAGWLLLAGASSSSYLSLSNGSGIPWNSRPCIRWTGHATSLRRLYVEQFCNFWRFLFSGGWFASLKLSRQKR